MYMYVEVTFGGALKAYLNFIRVEFERHKKSVPLFREELYRYRQQRYSTEKSKK